MSKLCATQSKKKKSEYTRGEKKKMKDICEQAEMCLKKGRGNEWPLTKISRKV